MSDVAQAEVAPVEAARRIKTLDVLRGLAVLGILAVNAPFFAAPWQTAVNPSLEPLAIDAGTAWSWFAPHVFFEAKFITLFSLLFGASLYLVGGDGGEAARDKVLHRRLGWMAVFGCIHGAAIWYGDILLIYAFSGVLVMMARSWRPRSLLIMGAGIYLLQQALAFKTAAAIPLVPADTLDGMRVRMWAPGAADVAAAAARFGGSFLDSLTANFGAWSQFISYALFGAVPRAIAVMMIGLALFKLDFLSGGLRNWIYWSVAAVGALALAAVAAQAQINYAAGFDYVHMQTRGSLVNPALAILITLLYASLLILCVKNGVLTWFTDALAPVGQMAFTNYIAQSLMMTAIFYGGRGLGLYGRIERDQLMFVVAGIWALQLLWSPLWLSRFRMGPLEWVWRRLSYGKPLAIGKVAAA